MWTQLYGRCLHTEKHDSHPDIAPVICRGFFFAAFETAVLSACRTNSAPEPNWRRLAIVLVLGVLGAALHRATRSGGELYNYSGLWIVRWFAWP